ncbi:MAG: DUF5647 family protein [bacterium]
MSTQSTRIFPHTFEQKNAQLVTEFDRYVMEHPGFADTISQGALLATEVEDGHAFNQWSRRLAQQQADPGQQVVFVRIKKLRPVQSRIEELAITA